MRPSTRFKKSSKKEGKGRDEMDEIGRVDGRDWKSGTSSKLSTSNDGRYFHCYLRVEFIDV